MRGRIFIGTSGWNYRAWSGGVFYPQGLRSDQWLEFYSGRFDSVEVNNTFYRLPEKRVFETWHDRTPSEFAFAVKANRFITHMKKLADPGQHVARFLEQASGLAEKLKVVLFQLPPRWKVNCARLEALCRFMAQQQTAPGVRSALEVRHVSWLSNASFEILREYGMALAFTDWPEVTVTEPVTADFVFVRRHGPAGLYASDYSDAMLRRDAERIQGWRREGRDVFVYFNNDVQGFAVKNAARLKSFL